MTTSSYSTIITVDQSPQEAFDAINDVRGWWSGNIEGDTGTLNAEWTYRYKNVHYSKQRITELIPGKRVVWHVMEGYLNFVNDVNEWKDTEIHFDIAEKGGKTEIRFTHAGLVPQYECFDMCSTAWSFYINESLRNFITTGKGDPNEKE